MSVPVYLSTLCGHVFGTACPYSPSVVVHVSYGRGSVLWRRCSMLCAFSAEQFGFVRVLLNVLSKYQVLGGDRPAGSVWFTGRAGTVLWTWRASEDYIYTFCSIHTHTCLTALCPGLPGWAGTRKVTPIWILLKQETVSGSGISWATCKSVPQITTDNHASTPPLIFLGRMPFLPPNQHRQNTEGTLQHTVHEKFAYTQKHHTKDIRQAD